MSKDKAPIKAVLVGYGFWGEKLARVLSDLGVLSAICDVEQSRLKAAKRRYPHIFCTNRLADVLRQRSISTAFVAVPTEMHIVVGEAVLKAGKDLFMEKPLAMTWAEGKKIVELAKQKKRILMVGHLLMYHPAVQQIEKWVRRNWFGKIHYIYSHRLNMGRVRRRENVTMSFAPHDLAVLFHILKKHPLKVSCGGGKFLDGAIADATVTSLEFEENIRAHVFVSWLHPYKVQSLVIVGDRRMAVFDDTKEWSKKLAIYKYDVKLRDGEAPPAGCVEPEYVQLVKEEPLLRECRAFLKCVEKKRSPLNSGENALAVLQTLDLSNESLARGGEPLFYNSPGDEVFIHPSAVVDGSARIGQGSRVWHFSHVSEGAAIGRHCILGQNVFVGRSVSIGDRVKIQNNVSVYEGVVLEEDVFCGPSAVFTNVINPRSFVDRKKEFRKTLVRRGAAIGANATILCGIEIGRYAFVAAGAVVTKDVPAYALVKGVPARLTGWMCFCGVGLRFSGKKARCRQCGRSFAKIKAGIKEDPRK